jgi:hypothetical protein
MLFSAARFTPFGGYDYFMAFSMQIHTPTQRKFHVHANMYR